MDNDHVTTSIHSFILMGTNVSVVDTHTHIYISLKVDNDHVSDVTTSIHSFILMGTNVSVVRFEFSWNQ